MMRQVWRIDRAGSLGRLRMVTEPLAPPGEGQARIRVEAIGLNFADIFACLGLYSATPKGPFIPGLEFAGVVEQLGPAGHSGAARNGPSVREGDRIVGLTRFGAYATALNAPASLITPLPTAWTPAEGAGWLVQGLTAWYGLVHQARVGRGEWVLLQSAAGGVGLVALSMLRTMGARMVAAVGTEEKRRVLVERHGLSPDLVLVRDRRHFGDQLDRVLKAAGADGFDVVFDAVAGPFLQPAFNRLRPRGRLVVYGAADFMPHTARALDPRLLFRYLRRPRIDPLSLMSENRSVSGFNLIWLWDQAHHLPSALDELRTLCPDPPVVGRRFSFDQAPDALRFLQGGQNIGKVILDV